MGLDGVEMRQVCPKVVGLGARAAQELYTGSGEKKHSFIMKTRCSVTITYRYFSIQSSEYRVLF